MEKMTLTVIDVCFLTAAAHFCGPRVSAKSSRLQVTSSSKHHGATVARPLRLRRVI